MPDYTVLWEIDIEANCPIEAVAIAHLIQMDPASTATAFKVRGQTDANYKPVDLFKVNLRAWKKAVADLSTTSGYVEWATQNI